MISEAESAAAVVALAKESLKKRGNLRLTATGRSMMPLLKPGQEFNLRAVQSDQLKPGDIVLIDLRHRLLLHRLIRLDLASGKRLAYTRGDSASELDQPVHLESILGVLQAPTRPFLYALSWNLANGLISKFVLVREEIFRKTSSQEAGKSLSYRLVCHFFGSRKK